MLVCGVKLTHDAAVAVIDADARKLLFCVEMEKVDNGARYAKMPRPAEQIAAVFKAEDVPLDAIDAWAVDGWKNGAIDGHDGAVASYHEFDSALGVGARSLLNGVARGELPVAKGRSEHYVSFPHIAGHVVGSYVTSPAARIGAAAWVLAWDGGQNPRLYRVDPAARAPVTFQVPLFEFYGIIYGIMSYYFGPYTKPEVAALSLAEIAERPYYGGYDTPGKLMSYIALGRANDGYIEALRAEYKALAERLTGNRLGFHQDGVLEHAFMRRAVVLADAMKVDEASALCSIHTMLGNMLVEMAMAVVPYGAHLIFTGGSALNIKWNSALRKCGHFSSVWVPPFPNDSGSALGAAACLAVTGTREWQIDWSVYSGPRLTASPGLKPGAGVECSPNELAVLFANKPEAVVAVLTGRAEIGPRALGHRSLFAAATLPETKARLNAIKNRESFRPVAPICLLRHAPQWFAPGSPDPHMLFDHTVHEGVRDRVPAILHLDGSARLQTMSAEDCPVVTSILERYHVLTGIPMLCNTSANLNGKGFFPNVESALRWDGADHVWSEGRLFNRKDLRK